MIRLKNMPQKTAACLIIMVMTLSLHAQTKTPQTVAIFLYSGAEILDFAGPAEVFSASDFETFTMSVDGKEILSQRFITVKPQYSLENAPIPDIVVFPGGGAGPPSKNPLIIEWVKKLHDRGTILMSVCTGAQILARADLLHGKNITTWHGYISDLQTLVPTSKVLENTRFVANGNIITTAGVSAGIDGALYLVSRLKGMEVAVSAARYMEYDKWDPRAGRVEH